MTEFILLKINCLRSSLGTTPSRTVVPRSYPTLRPSGVKLSKNCSWNSSFIKRKNDKSQSWYLSNLSKKKKLENFFGRLWVYSKKIFLVIFAVKRRMIRSNGPREWFINFFFAIKVKNWKSKSLKISFLSIKFSRLFVSITFKKLKIKYLEKDKFQFFLFLLIKIEKINERPISKNKKISYLKCSKQFL